MTGAAADQGTTLRLCESEGCETVLSRFNSRPVCASCEARLEIGGATIPLPRQPSYPSRPPAPERPTTEGAVPLPGRVVVRERSYAEMVAKPTRAAAPKAGPACAECGAPLPKDHKGWLCRLCAIAAEQPAEPQAPPESPPEKPSQKRTEHERSSATGAGPMRRLPADVVDQIKQPAAAAVHPAHARKFDWDDAVRRFQAGASFDVVGKQLGVAGKSVERVVRLALTDEQVNAIRKSRPTASRQGGRKRSFDWNEAARIYLETRNYTETARRIGYGESSVRNAIRAVLGSDTPPATGARPRPAPPASDSAPSIEEAKPEAPEPTPVAPPAEDPTPTPLPLDLRSGLEVRIEQIKLLLDHNTHERHALNDQARQLLEEWGDINWRLSKLTDELAA